VEFADHSVRVAGAEVASPTISTPAQPCARRAEGNGRELFGETASETDANDDGKDSLDSGVQRANHTVEFFFIDKSKRHFTAEKHCVLNANGEVGTDERFITSK
jgi:hypothetical protein